MGLISSKVVVRIACGPLQIVPIILSNSIIREKIGHKIFFTGKVAFLFKNLCFQQPLMCYRNDLISSTVIARIPVEPLQIVLLTLLHSIIRENVGHNVFFIGNIAFFSELCVFNNLLGPKKCSYRFRSNCQNTFWTLTNCPLGFATLDNTKTNRPLYFFHWACCLFFQKFVFSTTS